MSASFSGLAVTLVVLTVAMAARFAGVRPGHPFRVTLIEFVIGFAVISIVYFGGVVLLHQ